MPEPEAHKVGEPVALRDELLQPLGVALTLEDLEALLQPLGVALALEDLEALLQPLGVWLTLEHTESEAVGVNASVVA